MIISPLTVFKHTVQPLASVTYTQRIQTRSLKLLVDIGTMSFEVLSNGINWQVYGKIGVRVPYTLTSNKVNNVIEVTITNTGTQVEQIDITPLNDAVPIASSSW